MQADQSDSIAQGDASANKSDDNIEPVHVVLVDPFERINEGVSQATDVGCLLRVLGHSLDNLTDIAGLDPWLKKAIYDAHRVAELASASLEAALDIINSGETVLYEKRIPHQFRRTA